MTTPELQSPQELVAQLAQHRTLGSAPHAELEWLAAHGTYRSLAIDDVVSVKGEPVAGLNIILSGRLALFVDRGAGPQKLVEWHAGDVAGLLPYSRLTSSPGDSRVLEPSQILAIAREHLQAMTRECFVVTSILVHTMVDRTRMFTSNDLQNEKMVSLGKLSAGLAHELNNPASAIKRCAALLDERLAVSDKSARGLAAASLSEAQLAAIDAVHASFTSSLAQPPLTEIELSDREDAIAEWLARHRLDTRCAEPLAATAVTFDVLEHLVATVPEPALTDALHWLSAGCSIRNLSSKIQTSAAQISALVNAVKGFTHMDQANAAEPLDVCLGLADTVKVLQAKAREKSITVALDIEPGLPKVRGFAAELNQIWSNLIENALDAVAGNGSIQVRATSEDQSVIVRIVDNGPGIAPDIRSRIFDPFFTTKPQGQGVGLGLDVAQRLARHNDGSIQFDSHPGRTEFRVTLPIA